MARIKKIKEDLKKATKAVDEISVATEEVVAIEPEMHNGKKVVSSREVEINGKKYKEVTLEDGSTYTL